MHQTHSALAPTRWRWAWLGLAYLSLLLGLIGIGLPGLPTTPFILLAAFAAARGSPRLHRWMLEHRSLGRMIRDWEREGAVSRHAKWVASITMLACAALMFWVSHWLWPAVLGSVVMLVVALWLWMRPEPEGRLQIDTNKVIDRAAPESSKTNER